MNTDNNGKKKKSSPLAVIGIIAAVILAESGEAAAGLIAVIVVIAVIAAIVRAAAKKTGKSEEMHSHDRLNSMAPVSDTPEGLEHYKIQLDGFLSAGIIDRKEYNVLLRKYAELLKK